MGRGGRKGSVSGGSSTREARHQLFAAISDQWEEQFEKHSRFRQEDGEERSRKFRRRAISSAAVLSAAGAASAFVDPMWGAISLFTLGKGAVLVSKDVKTYISGGVVDPLPEDVAPWIGASITERLPLAKPPTSGETMSLLRSIAYVAGAEGVLDKFKRDQGEEEDRYGPLRKNRSGTIQDYDYDVGKFIIGWDDGTESSISAYELFAEGEIPFERIPQSLLSRSELKRIGNNIAKAKNAADDPDYAGRSYQELLETAMNELDVQYQIEQTESGQKLERAVQEMRQEEGTAHSPQDYELYQSRASLWPQIYRMLTS